MTWLVEWWQDECTSSVTMRVHQPLDGKRRERAGLLTLSPTNATRLLHALEDHPGVEVRLADF